MDVERLDFTVAVFAIVEAGQIILVRLEDADAERAASDAAGRGYVYAGSLAVDAGVPKVSIEPGFEAIVAAACYVFVGMLGPALKEYQLRAETLKG